MKRNADFTIRLGVKNLTSNKQGKDIIIKKNSTPKIFSGRSLEEVYLILKIEPEDKGTNVLIPISTTNAINNVKANNKQANQISFSNYCHYSSCVSSCLQPFCHQALNQDKQHKHLK